MKTETLIGLALAAAVGLGAFWFFKRRHATVLQSGKLYLSDPAYSQAGY